MAALKYSRQRESIKEFLRSRTDHPTEIGRASCRERV